MSKNNAPTPTVTAIGELHLEGNIIPHTFFQRPEFKSATDKGKVVTQHLAILIYADDLYWYRPTYHRNELTGQVERVTKKFSGDMLQRDYEYYAELFGVTKDQATAAIKFNVDRGLTRREFRTISIGGGRRASNVMFVEPCVGALKCLLKMPEADAPVWAWVADPPQPNLKKERGGIPKKQDTYPEKTGYLSPKNRTPILEIPDTNTKSSTETSPKSSTEKVVVEAPPVQAPTPMSNNNFQAAPKIETTQPPVGGSADADITDEELDLLFGSGTDHEVKPEVTASENVPAAPAAPEVVPAAAPFAPTPESVLEVGKLLAAKLGGKARLTTMLAEPGRDNVRQKASWLDLEPAKVQAILEDAKAKCAEEGATFVTAITRRLDLALGARDLTKPAAPGASTTPGTLGSAYDVKPSVVVAELTGQPLEDEPEAPCKFVPGAVWQDRAGQPVTIEALEGGRYRLSNGQKLLAFELTREYTFGEGAA